MPITKSRQIAKLLKLDGTVKDSLYDSDAIVTSAQLGVAAAAGTTVYSSADTLPTSATNGDQALVSSTNRLYIYSNGGWYNIALINTTPYWSSEANSSYDLSTTGAVTTITMLAVDSEGVPITYTATPDSNFNQFATVSKDSDNGRTFTVTPTDSENGTATSATGTITFKASDGVNFVSTLSTFSITFAPVWDSDNLVSSQQKLYSSDIAAGDILGYNVKMDELGTYALATAEAENSGAGAAYVFVKNDSDVWSQQQKLVASDRESNDSYGIDADLSRNGEYAIIGAYEEDSGTGVDLGSAYIYSRSGSTWTQQQKIQASDKTQGDYFGAGVAINSDGTWAVVGAIFEDTGATDAGAAYTFSRSGSTWTQRQKIQGVTSNTPRFGQCAALDSDASCMLIGATEESQSGTNSGAVYSYTRSGNTFTFQQKLASSDLAANDYFGSRVRITPDGLYCIIGARGENNQGAAYVFNRDSEGASWTQQQKLVPASRSDGGLFGFHVDISSDATIAIVAQTVTDPKAVIFTRDGSTWTEQTSINTSVRNTVDISGNGRHIIVGDYHDSTNGSQAGAVYFFKSG